MEIEMEILAMVAVALLGATIGLSAAARNGFDPGTAALGGALLGPFALLLLATKSTTRRQCPACAEWVRIEAHVCRYCRSALPPLPKERKPWMKEAPSDTDPAAPREIALEAPRTRTATTAAAVHQAAAAARQAAAELSATRCSNPACGRLIPVGDRYCPHCGRERVA